MSLPKRIVLTRGHNMEDKIEFYKVEGTKNMYDLVIDEYHNEDENAMAYLRIEDIILYVNKCIKKGYTILELK
jgi:hypothetical protein